MAIAYRIYSNSGLGDPINYSTPIAQVSSPTFTTQSLPAPGDYLFGIRAVDTTTNLEEANTNVRLRLVLDAAGNDITQRPNPPFALSVRPSTQGVHVSWCHRTSSPAAPPIGFRVYVGLDPMVDYTKPAAVVTYSPGPLLQTAEITNLSPGQKYRMSVRAYNAFDEEKNTQVATISYLRPYLSAVDHLTATTCLG